MLDKAEIEELGWTESTEGTFLFESASDFYINWVLKIVDEDLIRIYGMREVNEKLIPDYIKGYTGGIDSQMELYDIMVDLAIVPKEDDKLN